MGLATLLRDPETQLLVEGHWYWGSISVFIPDTYVAEGKGEVVGLKFMCVRK